MDGKHLGNMGFQALKEYFTLQSKTSRSLQSASYINPKNKLFLVKTWHTVCAQRPRDPEVIVLNTIFL